MKTESNSFSVLVLHIAWKSWKLKLILIYLYIYIYIYIHDNLTFGNRGSFQVGNLVAVVVPVPLP